MLIFIVKKRIEILRIFTLFLYTFSAILISCNWRIQGETRDSFLDGELKGDIEILAEQDITEDVSGVDIIDIIDINMDSYDVETRCTSNSDCDDREPCNGIEICGDAGICEAGTPLPDNSDCQKDGRNGKCTSGICIPFLCGNNQVEEGEECDDGNMITRDGCEPNCIFSCHLPSDCDDGLNCTSDDCIPNAAGKACTNEVQTGYCAIAGICYAEGERSPSEECLECRSGESVYGWSPVNDMTDCTGGVCCRGVCRVNGNCCRDQDCSGGFCTGTATSCDSFMNQSSCENQTGCMWIPSGDSVCRGTNSCDSFRNVPESHCTDCGCRAVGCGSGGCNCQGPGGDCTSITDSGTCVLCGCSWEVVYRCSGNHMGCNNFYTESQCNAEDGCHWLPSTCTDYTCI